jgi:hypothetical protein
VVDLRLGLVLLRRLFAGSPAAEPRAVVEELIVDSGFVPRYVGPIRYARNLEVCDCLCCMMCFQQHVAACSTGGTWQAMVTCLALRCYAAGCCQWPECLPGSAV